MARGRNKLYSYVDCIRNPINFVPSFCSPNRMLPKYQSVTMSKYLGQIFFI